ncbi:MAG: sigma-70 family RNA polymerase sigma factor [Thermoguttaceae bacterium]|jgi:RNA polymerase sigma-70 factor (ECF subfamily)|nr:sigma-70 family RNA polymerase sigma factor [Thermoguttaceae bacterium]
MSSTIDTTRTRATRISSVSDPTDEDLLLAYRNRGDRRAFDELVHRYEAELYSYLRNYLGDAQMAEDAFQTTFLQVHLKCGQFEPGRKVRPWLYTVATNQAIDAQRRNRRHRMVSLDRHRGEGRCDDETGPLTNLLDSDERDPAEQYQSAEEGEYVRQAVERLPEVLRQVVLLVYYQGLKYREAAEVLEVPVGTVKSRLHAAILKLNETLNLAQLFSNG